MAAAVIPVIVAMSNSNYVQREVVSFYVVIVIFLILYVWYNIAHASKFSSIKFNTRFNYTKIE